MKRINYFLLALIFLLIFFSLLLKTNNSANAGLGCFNLGDWGCTDEWTTCSATCGGGTRTEECYLVRMCDDCYYDTHDDEWVCGALHNCIDWWTESEDCNTQACPPACTANCGNWGACSKSCGGGTQSQSCTRANCSTYTNSQACNTQACPPTCTPSCGAWGACSKSCGGGTQSQSCTRADCSTYTNSQSCNTQTCVTYAWSIGAWGACSGGTCGGSGSQSRTVVCKNNSGTTVADSYCTGTKPATSQSCTMPACTYSWKYGLWGTCSLTCGSGTQTRSVWCQRSDGYTVANSYCSGTPPISNQACNTQACNQDPEGATDGGSCSNGTISFWGWAIDRDALSTSIPVQFYEGATYKGQCATNTFRSDINSAYGATGNHGFSCSISGLSVGNHTITTYGVNTPVGTNPKLPYGTNPQTINCPAAACNLPWGGTIASGSNVTAYQNNSVPCGSSCVSQTRTCNNGTLSGSYTNQSCSVAACNQNPIGGVDGGNCSGGTITTWGWALDQDALSTSIPVQFYEGATFRGQCATNVFLPGINSTYGATGNHGFSCSISGLSVGNHTITTYGVNTPAGTNPKLPYGTNPQTINCPAAACNLPWGGTIASGSNVTAYQNNSVLCGSSCVSQTRTCNNGTLSGSYTNQTCSVAGCASCTSPWGTSIVSGGVITAYQSSSVPCGSSCVSQFRLCTDGVLSGSYTNQACAVQSCNTKWKEVAP